MALRCSGLALKIGQVTADVVDQTNAAVAYSSGKGRRTVAISIHVLLVSGSGGTFTPNEPGPCRDQRELHPL